MGLLPQLAKCLYEKEQQAKESDLLKSKIERERTPVMVVEGKTDKKYFEKAMNIFGRIDDLKIIIVEGEGNVERRAKALRGWAKTLRDWQKDRGSFKPPTVIIMDIPQQNKKESSEFEEGNIKTIQLKGCHNFFTAGGIEALFPEEDTIKVAEEIENSLGKGYVKIIYPKNSPEVQEITIKGNKSEDKSGKMEFCRKMCAENGGKAEQVFKNFEEYINQAKEFFKKNK